MFEEGKFYMLKLIEHDKEFMERHEVLQVDRHLIKTRRHDGNEIIYNTASRNFLGAELQPVTTQSGIDMPSIGTSIRPRV